jgi:hypothetical protein
MYGIGKIGKPAEQKVLWSAFELLEYLKRQNSYTGFSSRGQHAFIYYYIIDIAIFFFINFGVASRISYHEWQILQ